MILVDSQIKESISKGDIVIKPFNLKNLGTNSYDICLSEHLAIYDIPKGSYLDSYSENKITRFKIPKEGYVLQPGILYLGSTVEYTETHKHVPVLEGKSSSARLGLKIHVTAGFGDVGFCGHWTLELEVTHPLKVYPGMPVGQISYTTTGIPEIPYNKKLSAKYSNQQSKPVESKMWKNKTDFQEPNVDSDFHLNRFYYWMFERQEIFVNRYIKKLPYPWSKDEILNENKFTNTHRDLDKNTVYYLSTIVPAMEKASAMEKVFMTIIWRMINNPFVFQEAGVLNDLWDWENYREQLRSSMHSKVTPFTTAYCISPYPKSVGNANGYLDDAFAYVFRNLDFITIPWLNDDFPVKESFNRLLSIPKSGAFIAYEIWSDLIHLKLNSLDANSLVNVGPGCKLGLSYIFPDAKGDKLLKDKITYLRDAAPKYFKDNGMDYKYITSAKKFSLRDIEHSLCEYGKYAKLVTPNLKSRTRKFRTPSSTPWLETYYENNIKIYHDK